jgi:hypothetical protein
MCSGGDKLRDVGSSEDAVRQHDMKKYRELGGNDGDAYRAALRSIGPKLDPLARLGIFKTQDSKSGGAETLRNEATGFQPMNPFYSTVATEAWAPARTTAAEYVSKAK